MSYMDELKKAGLEYLESQTKEGKARSKAKADTARAKYKAEKDQRKRTSKWYGKIGERSELTLRVNKCLPYETEYGEKYLYLMSDSAGSTFKWFTAKKDLSEGSTYRMKATVKKHESYQGEKATELSRCTVI